MPVPHDYYAPWSDEPHLHNRHHSRPYIEPDWQAHAAGHQLPVLSTIGRGPRGYGLKAANFDFSDSYFSFDLVNDSTGEVEQHIGPIPTGEVDMDVNGNSITFMTNVIGTDSEGHPIIRKTTKTLTLPKGEDGSRAYVRDSSGGSLEQTENNVYTMDWADLVYYNPETGDHTGYPQPRVYDLVVFETYKDVVEEGETVRKTYLQFGHVFDAEDPSALVVSSHYAFDMSSLKGLKGDKGDKGDTGQKGADGRDGADGKDGKDGQDGADGADGTSVEHSWNGTVLTITSASGTSSADLQGPPGSSSGVDLATAYGILPVSKGGTGTATASANYVFAGPTSGNAAAPSFRKLVAADIPASLPSTSVGGSAAKLATPRNLYTSLSTAYDSSNPVTFDGSAGKALPVSGTLPVKNGGTGRATLTANAILAGNGTSAVKMISTSSGALYATSAGAAPQFGQLPVAQGGTGASTAANARTNLGLGTAATHAHGDYALASHSHSGYAATSHTHAAGDITSGTLGVARGGTGITSNPSMLVNLGSTSAASVFAASPRPGVTGTLPIANGGTGATTAANARSNLGAAPAPTVLYNTTGAGTQSNSTQISISTINSYKHLKIYYSTNGAANNASADHSSIEVYDNTSSWTYAKPVGMCCHRIDNTHTQISLVEFTITDTGIAVGMRMFMNFGNGVAPEVGQDNKAYVYRVEGWN